MLRAESICHNFGGLEVLRDVSIHIRAGEIVGLIGPNGAGKTTLFNALSGFLNPAHGSIFFEGGDVTGLAPHRLAERGLVRTFQGARVFPRFTVRESLRVATDLPMRRNDAQAAALEGDVLETFGLEEWAEVEARSLPGGMMRILGIAMAMSAGAKMLLLDEPAAGLNDVEVAELQEVIRRAHSRGVTICVIEHNLHFLMGLVQRALVLDAGMLIADGTPYEVTRNPSVIEAFLGGDDIAEG